MSAVLRECARSGAPALFSSHQLDLVERLCDRVVIIRSGRLVAEGTIDRLRATAEPRRRAVVETDDSPDAAADAARALLPAFPTRGSPPQCTTGEPASSSPPTAPTSSPSAGPPSTWAACASWARSTAH